MGDQEAVEAAIASTRSYLPTFTVPLSGFRHAKAKQTTAEETIVLDRKIHYLRRKEEKIVRDLTEQKRLARKVFAAKAQRQYREHLNQLALQQREKERQAVRQKYHASKAQDNIKRDFVADKRKRIARELTEQRRLDKKRIAEAKKAILKENRRKRDKVQTCRQEAVEREQYNRKRQLKLLRSHRKRVDTADSFEVANRRSKISKQRAEQAELKLRLAEMEKLHERQMQALEQLVGFESKSFSARLPLHSVTVLESVASVPGGKKRIAWEE